MNISKKLVLALLLTAFANIMMQMFQVHRYTYDAYTHIFFADHYRRDWFSLWDARWYGGFSVTTYPPLSHQLMAALSFLLNTEVSYQVLTVVSALVLTYSTYLYSKIFIGEDGAQYAAIIASFLPATGIMLNAFGQLPTALSTALSLIAAYKFDEHLSTSSKSSLFQAVLWTALLGFTHHFTLVFFTPITILLVIVKNVRLGRSLIKRTLIYALFSLILLVIVLRPFIEYAINHPSWEEIPHATRYNLFARPDYAFPFFWAMYSFTIFLLPNAFIIAFRDKAIMSLFVVFAFLFILGLGGTTLLPAIIFGYLWNILTYDKFAFWAALTYIPFLAVMVSEAGAFIEKYYYGSASPLANKRARNLLLMAMFSGLVVSFTLSSSAGVLMGLQPLQSLSGKQLNILAEFLDANSEWKYITLGFGNQRLLLSSMTEAPMLDGGYNLAKSMPLLTTSGVESVDGAKYYSGGIDFLRRVLVEGSNNGLRFVISADSFYDQVLRDFGLKPLKMVPGETAVTIWEMPLAELGPASAFQPQKPLFQFLWGLTPMLFLCVALSMMFIDMAKCKA